MSLLSVDDLKTLVEQSQSPCVSLYMPTYQVGTEVQQNPIRFKNLIKVAETLLHHDYQLRPPEATALLQAAMDLDEENFWQHQNRGLAIFVAENFFRYYQIPLECEELVVVSDRFHLKPLLPLLTEDSTFYLLALSQKQIRFFEGSRYDIQEIELEGIATNIDDALQYDETAKDGQFRISTSKGGTNNSFQHAGSFHGQGSPDRDQHQLDILQFFHQLNDGLQPYLQDQQAPLILAGVEYLLPLYQEANTHSNLVDIIIPIENVFVVDPRMLHDRAWPIIEPHVTQAQTAAIDRYQNLSGTEKISTDLDQVVPAAFYGRVDQLFVAVGVQEWGKFDPQDNQLQVHPEVEPGDEDLLNAAAVQTILNGGTVYAVEPEKVPGNAPLAAVFRY